MWALMSVFTLIVLLNEASDSPLNLCYVSLGSLKIGVRFREKNPSRSSQRK